MNILSVNTLSNNNLLFKANPNIILTKEVVKNMPPEDILELSVKTLKAQDINIIRMVFSKISSFLKLIRTRYSYLKSNEFYFSINELNKVKNDKRKAQRIEKLLNEKIREEKIKKGLEINQSSNETIPIEYLILPNEEKLHQKEIKLLDLLIDKNDEERKKN